MIDLEAYADREAADMRKDTGKIDNDYLEALDELNAEFPGFPISSEDLLQYRTKSDRMEILNYAIPITGILLGVIAIIWLLGQLIAL